jgi:hypothetical protein
MTFLPPHRDKQRAPRLRLSDTTPAVLRLQNGWRVPGKLEVVSVTGGLLSLSKPLSQGCQVKVMFVTEKGPVLGAAEMLSPEHGGRQPFRFITLGADDRSRLQAVIQSSTDHSRSAYQQIEKFRAW